MTDETTNVEDPAISDAAVDQHDYEIGAVRVDLGEKPVRTLGVPNRVGSITTEALSQSWTKVLRSDMRRAVARLVCSVAFEISRQSSGGSGAPWPANVALVLTHADEVYARVPTSTATLTVITETYAS